MSYHENLYRAARVGGEAIRDKEYLSDAIAMVRNNILRELEATEAHDIEKVKGLHGRLILLMEVANGINNIIANGQQAAAEINSPGQ